MQLLATHSFSILERIDVGETFKNPAAALWGEWLSVSSNGSTWVKLGGSTMSEDEEEPFSILERIDVGETCR